MSAMHTTLATFRSVIKPPAMSSSTRTLATPSTLSRISCAVLPENAQIVNIDSVAVAQNLGVKVLEHVVTPRNAPQGLHRLFLADEDTFFHIVTLLDGAAHGLGLRIVAALVHEGENFILALELLELHLRIVRHERKCTHDDKAGDRDAHGRKGHESVRETCCACPRRKSKKNRVCA